jgi:outer membrane lipase/esterase
LHFLRRTALLASLCATVWVASCGGGTSTVDPLVPARFIAFGDGLTDVGFTSGVRYTVNDNSANSIWAETVAASYGLTFTAQSAGGQGWARGNALINSSGGPVLSVAEQITQYLAGNSIGDNDVHILNAGTTDMFALLAQYKAGTMTGAGVLAAATQAGKDYANQVKRLADAGGKHVVFIGVYDIGKTPASLAVTQPTLDCGGSGNVPLFSCVSTKFNEGLLVTADALRLGNSAYYVDAQFYFNLIINSPTTYGLTNSNTAVCTTPDASTCTPTTIVAGADYSKYVFADSQYPTPAAHRLFGSYVYSKMITRW